LRFLPWRDRERRDVLHLRDHLRATAERERRTRNERDERGEQED
jgi:hypothetical protein